MTSVKSNKLCSYPYNQCNQQWDDASQYPPNSLHQQPLHQYGSISQPITPNPINKTNLHQPSPADSPVSDYMDEMKTPPSSSPNKRECQINQMCKNAMSSPESGLWIQNGNECEYVLCSAHIANRWMCSICLWYFFLSSSVEKKLFAAFHILVVYMSVQWLLLVSEKARWKFRWTFILLHCYSQ